MQAVSRPPNRLLQTLPAAEFQSLYPHLETVELAKGTVLTEAGAPTPQVYLPHSNIVSMMVSLSEGQTVAQLPCSRPRIFGRPLSGTAACESYWRATSRPCSCRPSNPPRAMRLTRWNRACAPAVARAGFVRQRRIAADPGIPRANDRRTAQCGFDRGSRVSRPASSAIGRGHIEIRDMEGLRKTSCECYAAVRMQCDRLLNATG